MVEHIHFDPDTTPLYPFHVPDQDSRIKGVKGRMQADIMSKLKLSSDEQIKWILNEAPVFSEFYNKRIGTINFDISPDQIEKQLSKMENEILFEMYGKKKEVLH
jgi:hypothetical protein